MKAGQTGTFEEPLGFVNRVVENEKTVYSLVTLLPQEVANGQRDGVPA